ncbi:MAG: cell division protein SepF [Lachnospiraceae bacterium]|nr:cell division protein SepF [Lachnospiraceae bacterium]
MMVLDKLINSMKLNPDEYDDYDDEYDTEEEYLDEKPKKKVFAKAEEDEYLDEAPKAKPTPKVTPMKQQPKRGVSGMEVCVIKPTTVEDAREITETLLANRTVVLNLEGLDVDVAQRIIDFTSGSCFAIAGNLQKISHYIFIITPASVDISGDFQDILAGSFDVPSINSEL